MGKISDVWLGMSIPDAVENEGKTLLTTAITTGTSTDADDPIVISVS